MGLSETLIVRSKPITDAVVRLISDPLVQGLRDRKRRVAVVSPEMYAASETAPDVVVFHYDDQLAVDAIRSRQLPKLAACLGADIYDLEVYIRSHDIADIYFAPTEAHCALLRSQLMKPVCLLPESLDMTAVLGNLRPKPDKSVCWFGYPESFDKAMTSLLPVIEHSLNAGFIDRFALITDPKLVSAHDKIEILPYTIDTFANVLNEFNYVILSHFALDMHINSLIKSPNKLLTALHFGIIPLATATPSYGEVLRGYGLDCFLFDSPTALLGMLRDLDPARDARRIEESGIRSSIIQDFSPAKTSEAFVAGLATIASFEMTPNIALRQWQQTTKSQNGSRRGLIRALTDRVRQGRRPQTG